VMLVPLALSLRPRLVSVVFPSLDTTTHQLTTVWSGGTSLDQSVTSLDQSVCNHLKIFLMERGWTGKLVRADCGLAGFDYCGLNKGEELVVRLDIRQCRVQQFRSYQLCLAGEGDMCTDFFSLEMNIPFVQSRREEDQDFWREEDQDSWRKEDQDSWREEDQDSWREEDKEKSVSGFDDHKNRRSQESGKKNKEEYLTVSNNTIVSKGIFSVIAKEEDNKDEVVIFKNEEVSYSIRLVRLVQLCLLISLAIIFLSFICMICIYFC